MLEAQPRQAALHDEDGHRCAPFSSSTKARSEIASSSPPAAAPGSAAVRRSSTCPCAANRCSATPSGGLIRVRLEGPVGLAALITRESADRLGVSPGAEVTALLKTTALHVFGAHR